MFGKLANIEINTDCMIMYANHDNTFVNAFFGLKILGSINISPINMNFTWKCHIILMLFLMLNLSYFADLHMVALY